jgi:hypothetical protein
MAQFASLQEGRVQLASTRAQNEELEKELMALQIELQTPAHTNAMPILQIFTAFRVFCGFMFLFSNIQVEHDEFGELLIAEGTIYVVYL